MRPRAPRLPNWVSRADQERRRDRRGEIERQRDHRHRLGELGLVVEHQRDRRPRHRHRAAAGAVEQDEGRHRPGRALAHHQDQHGHRQRRAGDQPGRDAVPPSAAEKIQPAGADLDHAEHRTESDGLRRRQPLRPEQFDQDGADAEIDEGIEGDRGHDETERAPRDRRRIRSLGRGTAIALGNSPAPGRERIERKRHEDQRGGIDEARPTPAEVAAQERCGRPEDAVGQSRHQHQRADRALGLPPGNLVQHDIGPGRQRGAAGDAEDDPRGEIEHGLARERQQHEARHRDDRADHHDLARAMPCKRLGEPGSAHAHRDIENGRAGKHHRQAHAEIGRKIAPDDGGKSDRAPSDKLGDCKHQQDADQPAVRFQEPHSKYRLPGRRRSRL